MAPPRPRAAALPLRADDLLDEETMDAGVARELRVERGRQEVALARGDRVAVDGAARLELRIGSTAVRLSGGSELEIIRLDDDRIDLFLHSGSAAVRVRSPEVAREVELATAEGRFSSRGTRGSG